MPFKILILLCCLSSLFTHTLLAQESRGTLRLATTTSTDNSGLLKEILPAFERESGYQVHVIAVGTGKALRMGRDGDVDVLLVHAPAAEQKFIGEGFNEKRYAVMYNDFVMVGPANDPAGLGTAMSINQAMHKIAQQKAPFVSRGDDSGTHKKERGLWKIAGLDPQDSWYREAGQGMGKVLQIAGEMGAYTLTDRGTWLAYEDKLPLKIVFEKDPEMFNPYSIIAIDPRRFADTHFDAAMALVKWFVSPATQKRIAAFRINGKQLFIPSAEPAQQQALGVR